MEQNEYPVQPEQTAYSWTPPELPVYPTGKRELLFGLVILLCSVFLWNCILYGGFNLGFALGGIAMILCSAGYLYSRGARFDRYSGALLVLACLTAAGFARSSDGFVKLILLLFLIFAVNLSLCLASGQNRRSPNGFGTLLDASRAAFVFSFASMTAAGRGLNEARKNAGSLGKKGTAAVLGLAVAAPVVAVMVFLLMRADAAFEGLMDLLPETDWEEPLRSLLFGGIMGITLYSRGTGLIHREKAPSAPSRRRGIHPVTVNTILACVCMVYGVYLFSQLAYLSGGMSGILPQGYTLAQYARRGFFEMAWLSAINLGIVCLAIGVVEKPDKAPLLTRSLCLFLGMVTLFLIAAASAKMLLYIGSYGLTRLRVLTQVIMIWLALTTVLVCVWLFRPTLPYMKAVVLSAMILGCTVLWADVDTQVARYNVHAYRSGVLDTIDVAHLAGLGYGAVPYIQELTEDSDPDVAETARDILNNRSCRTEDFRDWNYTKAKAGEILSP